MVATPLCLKIIFSSSRHDSGCDTRYTSHTLSLGANVIQLQVQRWDNIQQSLVQKHCSMTTNNVGSNANIVEKR